MWLPSQLNACQVLRNFHVWFAGWDGPATFTYVAVAIAEALSCRSTRFHPGGAAIEFPAVCTIKWATMTSPLCVPAGSPMVSVEPPVPLLPAAVVRSEIPPPGCGVGVGVGVDVEVGVGVGVEVDVGVGAGVDVEVGVGVGVDVAPAGSSAISIVILEFAPALC